MSSRSQRRIRRGSCACRKRSKTHEHGGTVPSREGRGCSGSEGNGGVKTISIVDIDDDDSGWTGSFERWKGAVTGAGDRPAASRRSASISRALDLILIETRRVASTGSSSSADFATGEPRSRFCSSPRARTAQRARAPSISVRRAGIRRTAGSRSFSPTWAQCCGAGGPCRLGGSRKSRRGCSGGKWFRIKPDWHG